MKQIPTLNLLPHSLGHTQRGKLIYDRIGSWSEMWIAHWTWTAADHFEAEKIIREKVLKGYFTKKVMYINNSRQTMYRMEDTSDQALLVAQMHHELGKRKQK
jgi:hypothetical protein